MAQGEVVGVPEVLHKHRLAPRDFLEFGGIRFPAWWRRLFLATAVGAAWSLLIVPVAAQKGGEQGQPDKLAASNLQAESGCSATRAGKRIIALSWSAPQLPAKEHVIEVTMYRGGQFEALQRVSGEARSFEWVGARTGIRYYWRIRSMTDKGWITSEVARAVGPVCVGD